MPRVTGKAASDRSKNSVPSHMSIAPEPHDCDDIDPKTPTRRLELGQDSVARADSERTHPEPRGAAMKLHPYYYGPASASNTVKGRRAPLQRQYAKVFDVDELDRLELSFNIKNGLKFREINTDVLDICRFFPRSSNKPWYDPLLGLLNSSRAPGAPYKDFCEVICQCRSCELLVALPFMENHRCPAGADVARASPSNVIDFVDGLENMNMESSESVIGVSLQSLQSLYIQCNRCLAIVAKDSSAFHQCAA